MKIAALVSRVLLGLMFLVFGLNGFLHFFPQGPMPPGPAGQFIGVLAATHYISFVFALQVVCGILFLVNRYVPLAVAMIAPVIVNILLFHALMDPAGILPGAFATLFWIIVAYRVRSAFAGIFRSRFEG
jgi:putative oxidoreductase